MSLKDKATGRAKRAAGSLTGNSSLRRQGSKEEKKAEAKEQRDRARAKAKQKTKEIADLEKKT